MIPRIVATYTTLPSRYEVLERSIQTLKNQSVPLQAIYVTLPKKARRLNQEYPEPPESLKKLCTIVRSDTDYGPLTKIYGALVSESDPNTVIISCDDDVGFPSNFVETLLKHHQARPQVAICGTGALLGNGMYLLSIVSTVKPFTHWRRFTGFSIPSKGRKIDLVFGVAGVLYTRGMFPKKSDLYEDLLEYALRDDDIFHNDDILISGYLCKKGIARYIYEDIPEITHFNGSDALSGNLIKMWNRMGRALTKIQDLGMFQEMEVTSAAETPVARGFILLLFLIIVIWFFFQNILDYHSFSGPSTAAFVDF